MKKNKLMTVIMAATVAAGLLTGCGSNDAADTATDASADAATNEATDAATDAATDEAADAAATDTNADLSGSIAMAGSTSMEKLANAVAEAFMEKYPGVSVTAEFTGSRPQHGEKRENDRYGFPDERLPVQRHRPRL